MRFSGKVEALQEMHDAGMSVPAIDERPSLIGYVWLWEAFWDLTTCRPVGEVAGPIPWTAIQRYAEVEKLNADDAYALHQVVRHMDQAFLSYFEKKRSAQQKRGRK